MGSRAAALIAALAVLLCGAGAAQAADAFHKPETRAERSLDALLLRGGDEAGMVWFAIGQPSRDRSKDGRFSPLFSKALVAAWRKAEADAVAENCGGRYIKGDI